MSWGHFRGHQGGILGGDGGLWGQAVGQGSPGGSARTGGVSGLPKPPPSPGSYRTRPLVFLSTEAAKLCVTPTRLVPSTSTIRSFTWILGTRTPSRPLASPGAHLEPLAAPTPAPAAAGGCPRPYLPSRWAAPPSVTVLTKIPSFSRPMSAPAPIPMMLIPSPSESVGTQSRVLAGWHLQGDAPQGSGGGLGAGPTFLQLHGEEVEPLHALLQLVLGRGRHGIHVLIAAVVILVGVSAEHLGDEGGLSQGQTPQEPPGNAGLGLSPRDTRESPVPNRGTWSEGELGGAQRG